MNDLIVIPANTGAYNLCKVINVDDDEVNLVCENVEYFNNMVRFINPKYKTIAKSVVIQQPFPCFSKESYQNIVKYENDSLINMYWFDEDEINCYIQTNSFCVNTTAVKGICEHNENVMKSIAKWAFISYDDALKKVNETTKENNIRSIEDSKTLLTLENTLATVCERKAIYLYNNADSKYDYNKRMYDRLPFFIKWFKKFKLKKPVWTQYLKDTVLTDEEIQKVKELLEKETKYYFTPVNQDGDNE